MVKPYRIPTISMVPTLQVGDMVLANRFIYHLHSPHRGDVIVFHPPGRGDVPIKGSTHEASVNYIKRIIGLPGDRVRIRHGVVSICYARRTSTASRARRAVRRTSIRSSAQFTGNYNVPPGDYFVMGDNRGNSRGQPRVGLLAAPKHHRQGVRRVLAA